MDFSSERLKQKAVEFGFNLVGITPAVPSPTLNAYLKWVDKGMHGAMGYMARPDRIERRENLDVILPNIQSLVVIGLDYAQVFPSEVLNDPSRGRIASYAWNLDYHDVIGERLRLLVEWMQVESSVPFKVKHYVDTGAILERSHAQQAGLGFIGKNTMLIHPRRGSSFFLAEILTTQVFDSYDEPHRSTMCGTCTRCLSACPTDAFPEPYVLDARLCISYHTIENKGWIDRQLRDKFGNWIFGCDICQDVCPFQRFQVPSQEAAFTPLSIDRAAPKLLDILQMDETNFRERFYGSPIFRLRRDRLVRNACIAAGNWGDGQAIPSLMALLADANPLVRGHAAWAIGTIMGDAAVPILKRHLNHETDPQVQAELQLLL